MWGGEGGGLLKLGPGPAFQPDLQTIHIGNLSSAQLFVVTPLVHTTPGTRAPLAVADDGGETSQDVSNTEADWAREE